MSAIRDRISNDIKEAMKAKDQSRLDALRLIKAEVLKRETSGEASALDEAGLIKMLQSMKKQREESIQQFEKGGRAELAEKERSEIRVIDTYLPQPVSAEALARAVDEAIAESGATDPREMGKVMKLAMEKAGAGADGKQVSALVKEKLSAKKG